jgi:type IV pilus assembly protein PilO
MKTSNAALTTFIDKKFIPLAPRIKIAVTLALIIIPLVIFYFVSFQPESDKITNLETQRSTSLKKSEK